VKKLHHFDWENKWGAAWGCAGDSDTITKFTDKMFTLLDNEPEGSDLPRLQELTEAAGKEIHENYEQASLEIVAGFWSMTKSLQYSLCHMDVKHGNCLSSHYDYACAGMDLSLGKFTLENLHHTSMAIGEGVGLGIFTTHLMKDTADGVGGPVQLMTWRMGKSTWSDYEQEYINSIEEKYKTEDVAQLIKEYWGQKNPSWLPPL